MAISLTPSIISWCLLFSVAEVMTIQKLTIVGVGLIGGSIGLAARRRDLADQVVGVGRQTSTLDKAQELGAITEGTLELDKGVFGANFVVFCTPVHLISKQILQAAPHLAKGTLLTDAGSTKGSIVRELEGKLPKEVHFLGSHPLAGSEKRGPEHADADLFQDRLTILTPTEQTQESTLQQVQEFWKGLGSHIKLMSPEAHDQALALTSHLPHLLASALAGILPEDLYELTATGFRDTTRVAASDPSIWTGIFQQNREAVLQTLQILNQRLNEFQQALENNEKPRIDSLLAQAKKVRDALGS